MKRKDGKPRADYDEELDYQILDLIKVKRHLSTERIRTNLNEIYARKLGWITIKRHLNRLLESNKIKIFYESEGEKKIRIYIINKNK